MGRKLFSGVTFACVKPSNLLNFSCHSPTTCHHPTPRLTALVKSWELSAIGEDLKLVVPQLLHWGIDKKVPQCNSINITTFVTANTTRRLRHLGKCCASFNRSLILATWFIHVATADITTLINHAVRHAGHPRAKAGLTNLNIIFHLNNLALPQGRPTPDTAHWRKAPLILLFLLSVWAQRLFLQPVRVLTNTVLCAPRQESAHSQPQAIMRNCFMDIRGTNLV